MNNHKLTESVKVYRALLEEILDDGVEIESIILFLNYMTSVDLSSETKSPLSDTHHDCNCGNLSVAYINLVDYGVSKTDLTAFCDRYSSVLSYDEILTSDDLA